MFDFIVKNDENLILFLQDFGANHIISLQILQ